MCKHCGRNTKIVLEYDTMDETLAVNVEACAASGQSEIQPLLDAGVRQILIPRRYHDKGLIMLLRAAATMMVGALGDVEEDRGIDMVIMNNDVVREGRDDQHAVRFLERVNDGQSLDAAYKAAYVDVMLPSDADAN